MSSRSKGPPDAILMFTAMVLACLGLVMVFSASAVTSSQRFGDPYYFFKRQFMWAILSFFIMLVFMRVDYKLLKRLAPAIMVIGIIALLAVFIPGLGISAKGATRQLGLGVISFTPSELAKLCMVIFLSSFLSSRVEKTNDLVKGFLPPVAIAGAVCCLVMAQRDLGTTLVIAFTAGILLFAAGCQVKHLVAFGLLGIAGFVVAIVKTPFRFKRMLAFIDPWKYADQAGFQIIQSLYALGSGGLFGVGLGRSRQKFFWLPEQHTDFIFAILGEELGYIGVLLVLILFFIFAWRGYRVAIKADDTFASLLATGITTMILFQALLNIGVVSGSLPVTGIPLPFISYGGSSLALNMACVGILLNISRYASLK